jgi:hypothetical protein
MREFMGRRVTMSVYLFGKVFTESSNSGDTNRRMSTCAQEVDVTISFDSLDEDDERAIDELIGPGPGVTFSVSTRADGSGGASGLWAEAQRLGLSLLSEGRATPLSVTPKSFDQIKWPEGYDLGMRKCRLQRVLCAIALTPEYERMCVALVEGGLESVHEDEASRCIGAIVRKVVLPWDCVSGVLYLWPMPRGIERSRLVQLILPNGA